LGRVFFGQSTKDTIGDSNNLNNIPILPNFEDIYTCTTWVSVASETGLFAALLSTDGVSSPAMMSGIFGPVYI
jgi:hypothetical protein